MIPPSWRASLRHPWWPEAAWITVALASGAAALARSHLPLRYATNGAWYEYLQLAEQFRDPARVVQVNPWRAPMWGYLVANLGELTGWSSARAAFLVSSISVVLVLVAAASMARVLGGRLAAVVAAISGLWLVPLLQSAHWLDPYPAVGACCGLALAAGAAAARWRWRWAAVGAAFAGGLAFAMDGRAVGCALAGGVLAIMGVWSRPWLQRVVSILACLVLLGGPGLANRWLDERTGVERTPLLSQIAEQHLLAAPGARVEQVDRDQIPPPTLSALWPLVADHEAFLILRANATHGHGVRSGLILLPLLVLLVLPAEAWGGRARLVGAALALPPAVVLLVAMCLVAFFPRYMTPCWALMLALAPAATMRGYQALARRVGPLPAALLAGVPGLLWTGLLWPGILRPLPVPDLSSHTGAAPGLFAFAAWAGPDLTPSDVVLDCGQIPVGALLPPGVGYRHVDPKARSRGATSAGSACMALALAEGPSAYTWLLRASNVMHPDVAGAGDLEARGWRQVQDIDGATVEVWRRSPP